jgi:hypothetical protein
MAQLRGVSAKNCADGITVVGGSHANAVLAEVESASNDGIRVDASFAQCDQVVATGCGRFGILAIRGSQVHCDFSTLDDAGTDGLRAESASMVSAKSVSAKNAGAVGIHALDGGYITARNSETSGYNSQGLLAQTGGYIVARGAVATDVTPASTDIVVSRGSTIIAQDSTGDLNQTANTITANGVIYK